mgnify:CR=1 FL=1
MNDYTCVMTDVRNDCWSSLVLAELQYEGKLTYRELENLICNTETAAQRIVRLLAIIG